MRKEIPKYFNKKLNLPVLLMGMLCANMSFSQDLENIGSKTVDKVKNSPLKINGGISANSIFYDSNGRSAREPFTYFLQGNINISWLTFSMPLSYSFTNQGSNLDYQTPFKFNRLSLHPKYKWIQSHMGDVVMTFSPYTLSGHQFTGGGVELTPEGNFSISAMAGRLLKATEDDGNPQTLPAFKRMGYGTKLGWEQDTYKIGLIGFYAKDAINSIAAVPDDRGIAPKENLVIGFDGEVTIAEHYTIKTEYASTAITQDLRAEPTGTKGSGLAALLFDDRGSTEYYDAFKAGVEMQVDRMQLGLGYEHIDPGYETLGAYFFNNDFENLTLSAASPLFNDKLNLSFNIGYQRDNLENQKTQATSRFVGAMNATLRATDKITVTGTYSNFSTHTNKSLNQFEDINDSDLTDEDLEALNFKQLSQNANVNVNWVLIEGEKNSQNINLNYSLASSANEQAGVIRVGQANNFHNANAVYTIGFPKNNLNISSSLNYNYSDIGRDDSNAYGGALDIGKKFFENKLNSTFGVAYNTNNNKDTKTDVLNFRVNASTVIAEKHNFNLNAVQLFSSTTNQDGLNELTVTFGYVYTFDIGKPKFRKKEKQEKEFEFTYKERTFRGAHEKISSEILGISKEDSFKEICQIKAVNKNLLVLQKNMLVNESKSDKAYKSAAIDYLKYLYDKNGFLNTYYSLLFKGAQKLYADANVLDYIKEDYINAQADVNTLKAKGESIPSEVLKDLKLKEKKYKAHKWMLEQQLEGLTYQDIIDSKGLLLEFKEKNVSKIFIMLNKGTSSYDIQNHLEVALADFYHKKSYQIKDYKLLED